ncbi:MAG: hypothetical protein Q9162_006077 [Coniocarpon cinnabarinum]
MNAIPKPSKVQLTFKNPAPPGCITVQARKLDAPPKHERDKIKGPLEEFEDLIEQVGQLKMIVPRGPTKERGSSKRQYVLDDRMLAVMLIFEKLGKLPQEGDPWTSESMSLLPRFYSDGTVDIHYGHLGKCAWVYVDGKCHIVLANSMYALVGDMDIPGSTSALNDDGKLPLFSVSEQPFPFELLGGNWPLDQLTNLTYDDYVKLFVQPRDRAAIKKAKMRNEVERAVKKDRRNKLNSDAKEAVKTGTPVMGGLPKTSPLQSLQNHIKALHESGDYYHSGPVPSAEEFRASDGEPLCNVRRYQPQLYNNPKGARSSIGVLDTCTSNPFAARSESASVKSSFTRQPSRRSSARDSTHSSAHEHSNKPSDAHSARTSSRHRSGSTATPSGHHTSSRSTSRRPSVSTRPSSVAPSSSSSKLAPSEQWRMMYSHDQYVETESKYGRSKFS